MHSCGNPVWMKQRLHRGRHFKQEDDRTNGALGGRGERSRSGRKAKSCKTLSNSFIYMVIFLDDLALRMENLHAMGPYQYWQRPRSVSSPLNSSSGCVENGRVTFCDWQCSRSISSLLDSLSGRVKSSEVVFPTASIPGRPLRIRPQSAAWVSVPANLPE